MNKYYDEGVKVFALGGLGEVGKNTYCIESNKSIILIDAGVKFPENNLPGVDYIIPDYSYLKANQNKVKALFITHGHEDHIGAIPFLVQLVRIPVIYAPKLAIELIKHKLEYARLKETVKLVEYKPDSLIPVDEEMKLSFFRVTHSIPDAFGIVVDTKEGRIVTTGDFKIDLTPVGNDIELNKIARIGEEGVDLLLSDSTNAELEGYTPSEKNVYQSLCDVFKKAPGRIIVSTFSSNISRIQQVVLASYQFNRKIVIVGKSMEFAVSISRSNGYIKIPDTSLVSVENINTLRSSETCIICTGSQGEVNAALSKIARGEHKNIHIIPGDTVVFSSSPIPGNGEAIENIVNDLSKLGAVVMRNGVFSLHSSGHPSKQELRLMLKLVKPKYFMPAHGECRMLKIHGALAETVGVNKDNIFILDNGEALILHNHEVSRTTKINTDDVYLDGSNNIYGINSTVIEDRILLKEAGFVFVVTTLSRNNKDIIVKPTLYLKGIVISNEEKIKEYIENNLLKGLENLHNRTTDAIEDFLKDTTRNLIYKYTELEPLVTSLVLNIK